MAKPHWASTDETGSPTVQPGERVNLTEALDGAPTRDDLVVVGGTQFSTAELEATISSTAAALAERSVGSGDRVAFQLPVGVEAVVLYRACWRLGAVAAALHPRAGSAQLVPTLEALDPVVRVAGPGSPAADLPGVLDVSCLRGGAEVPPGSVASSDDALVMFTSGSSGVPKGVIHTHGGLLYKVRQLLEVHGLGPEDVVLMPAPLAHVSGLLHGVLVPGVAGMRTVLMPNWDPADALDLIETEAVTYMVGPPTFFLALMDDPAFSSQRTQSLRMLSCGGAGVTPAFVERARNELGAVVKRSYGSTEAPTVATSRFDDPPEQMSGTDGRSFDETQIRVDGHGEVWVRGPEVARGYLEPTQGDGVFVDGWFRTGDLGRLDGKWLTITGRSDDRIIRAGENISAREVEMHLEAHQSIDQAVVVGMPDDRLGERVAAFVVASDHFDLEICRSWFATRELAPFLTPEHLEVVELLPLLASGKFDRSELRSRLEPPQ